MPSPSIPIFPLSLSPLFPPRQWGAENCLRASGLALVAQRSLLRCSRGGHLILFPFPAATAKEASQTFPRLAEKQRYRLLLTCFQAPACCDLLGCRCICCLQLPRLRPALHLSQALGSATWLQHCQQRGVPVLRDAPCAAVLQGDLLLGRRAELCVFMLAALVGNECGFLGGRSPPPPLRLC